MFERMLVRALMLWLALAPWSAHATQSELVPPTSGIYTGVQFSQLLGDAFKSLASCNKGPTAPANVAAGVVDGLCWIDDSGSPWLKKRYVNGAWVVEGALDDANGLFVGVLGGGQASVASASTTDLGSVPQANVTVTGTTGISSFGSTAPDGTIKFIRFDNALIITHSSSLKVPAGYPLTTAADDRAIVTYLGTGAWEITQYTRANGVPIDLSMLGKPQFTFGTPVTGLEAYGAGQTLVRANYPAYVARTTRAQNATRVSGNATLTSVSDTSGMGAGMPIEGTGIPAATTILSVTSSTIVMSANATSSATSTATVFFTGYGQAGDSTTIGLPDCRGRMIAGRDDGGSTAASRVTTAGSGINGAARNAGGGAQSVTVAQANLPNVSFTNSGIAVTNAPHDHTGTYTNSVSGNISYQTFNVPAGSTPLLVAGSGTAVNIGSASATANVSVTAQGSAASGGSGTALNKMPPTLIADCIVRIVP